MSLKTDKDFEDFSPIFKIFSNTDISPYTHKQALESSKFTFILPGCLYCTGKRTKILRRNYFICI